MHSHFRSIRTKLLITTLSIYLVFVAIILSVWYFSLKKEAEKTAVNNMKTMIEISNTSFERQLRDIINVTALATVRSSNTLSTNIINIMSRDDLTDAEIVAYRKEALNYLVSLCSFKENLNGLMLSDMQGHNTVSYGVTTSYDYISENGYIELLSQTSGTLFTEPHYTNQWYRNKNDLVFSILRPVYNFSNQFIGFAVADVNCQMFKSNFDIDPTNPFSLYIINSSAEKVIFTPDNNIMDLNSDTALDPGIMEHISGESGDFFYPVHGENMLIVYHKSALTGWYTLNLIPEAQIISAFSHASRSNLYITILLTLILSLLIYLTCTVLTNNIVRLTRTVETIGANNLQPVLMIHSNDEVGALAIQFQNMLDRIQQLLLQIQKEEAEKRNAEIAALQYQINPHFLYNTLNTIKFLASLQGSENIVMVAESLSSLMHISMRGRPFITIKEDIQFVQSYLTLQSYRETSVFQYQIDVEPELLDFVLPKLLIQPLVENALKHGLSQKAVNGIIQISYFREKETLHIRVEDNGIGISEERISEIFSRNQSANAGHIGIYNISERIKLYFGDNYGIQADSQEGLYTRFEIRIPLLKESDVKSYEKNITC